MKNNVKDQSIIITGGSNGFGLETARQLLAMGAKVTITGRNKDRLDQAVASLGGGQRLLAIQADACSTDDWRKVVAAVVDQWGTIGTLVLNHGAGVKIAPVEEMDDASIREVLDINLSSVVKGCREAIPSMKKAGRGHIITVTSACAHYSWPNWGVYTAAKAGLIGFTKCLHIEMSAWGGKASVFTPGAARTGFCDAAGLDASWQTNLPGAEEVARTLVHCIDLPDNCFIQEVMIWGTAQVPAMVNPF